MIADPNCQTFLADTRDEAFMNLLATRRMVDRVHQAHSSFTCAESDQTSKLPSGDFLRLSQLAPTTMAQSANWNFGVFKQQGS